jgi:hypothetical protein
MSDRRRENERGGGRGTCAVCDFYGWFGLWGRWCAWLLGLGRGLICGAHGGQSAGLHVTLCI